MRTWTAVTPSTLTLSPDLALLLAPVRLTSSPSTTAEDYVGRAEGVILDDAGRLAAFVVRLSPRLVGGSSRTLLPASAMTVTDDSVLILAWPQEKLLAQRRLDEDLQPQNAAAGGSPAAVPSPPVATTGVGPGEGKVDVNETVKEGVEGSAIGAVVGGILGGLAGGPVLGLALAAFFGVGGGLAGFISGGGQETHGAPEGAEPDTTTANRDNAAIARLEERLRDPMLTTDGLVHMTRFTPLVSNERSLEPQPSTAHVP
jgi:hypothetical protein